MTISNHQAYEAYRKLKNYFYFDNTSLFIRHQIAEFERDFHPAQGKVVIRDMFEKKLIPVLKILNENDNDLLSEYLNIISFRYNLPGDRYVAASDKRLGEDQSFFGAFVVFSHFCVFFARFVWR